MKNISSTMRYLQLLIASLCIVITVQSQTTTFTEVTKLVAESRNDYNGFGEDVDIDGDFAVIGEVLDSYDENEQNYVIRAGKINIAKKVNGQWEIIQVISAPNRADYDYFGQAVDISGDYIFACKPFTLNAEGEVYIYKRDGGDADNFSLVQTIQASIPEGNGFFGYRLDVDGDYAVISAFREDRNASGGTTTDAGAVYIFQNMGGTWAEIKRMESPNRSQNGDFGIGVAIDGGHIVVGEWNYDGAGNSNVGAAYVYNKDTGGTNNWGLVKQLNPSMAGLYLRFGGAVDISGDNIIVGAHEDDNLSGTLTDDYGAAYVYNKDTGGANNWGEVKRLVATNPAITDHFGISVAIDGDHIVVGAEQEDEDTANGNTMNDAGSVFFFKRNNGGTNNWGLMNKAVPSVRDMDDQFGNAVAIDGCTVIIGSRENNTDANNANSSFNGPGAAYIFANELYTELAATPATCDTDAVVTARNASGTVTNYEFFEDANANRQWDAGETRQNGTSNTYTATGLGSMDEVGVVMTNSAGERCETIIDISRDCIRLDATVHLQAALENSPTAGEMNTVLAQNSMIPLAEPYTAMGYTHVGGGGGEMTTASVLNDATLGIVDWVVLEVRDPNTPTNILATASALLRKNGKIVDVTGTGFPDFSLTPNKEYHVAIKHRNHLGTMTASPMILNY
ncbi:MAG: hypothetical protein AAF738_07250 [Bacteroidota bacterium]